MPPEKLLLDLQTCRRVLWVWAIAGIFCVPGVRAQQTPTNGPATEDSKKTDEFYRPELVQVFHESKHVCDRLASAP